MSTVDEPSDRAEDAVRARVVAERTAQGLPPQLEDRATIDYVARILGTALPPK